jgi:hypothetical protein
MKRVNEHKPQKVINCWGKTGLLDAWDAGKRDGLLQQAIDRLFASTVAGYDGICGMESTADDQGAEKTSGFDCPGSTKVYRKTGEITVQECEEDADIEAELYMQLLWRPNSMMR